MVSDWHVVKLSLNWRQVVVKLLHLGAEKQTQKFRISLSISHIVVITGGGRCRARHNMSDPPCRQIWAGRAGTDGTSGSRTDREIPNILDYFLGLS